MKVLLTQPITAFVKEPPNIPDLGLGYIASALKKAGHAVFIRDWNMDPSIAGLKKWLAEGRPEVIGLKVFTKDVGAAQKTVSIIREVLPAAVIITGGPHPSSVAPDELMNDFAECNFAIRGEAEKSLPMLLDLIAEPMPAERAKEIPGLVWRENNRVLSNPIQLTKDLDSIDFPLWELINPNAYKAVVLGSGKKEGSAAPIITTRGCPGKCSFCSAFNINGRRIRFRSPSNVFAEMSLLYDKYNVRKFMFQDNCFTSIKTNLSELCELILKAKMDIEWDCVSYESLENLTDQILALMQHAGCRMIHIGIESGAEKTRKTMYKASSLEMIAEKIRLMRKNGIKTGAWFMLGFPGETVKEMKKSISYAFSLRAELVAFTVCFPLPGSAVYSYIKGKYGFDRIDWAAFDVYNSEYPASEASSQTIAGLLKLVRLRLRLKNQIRKLASLLPGK